MYTFLYKKYTCTLVSTQTKIRLARASADRPLATNVWESVHFEFNSNIYHVIYYIQNKNKNIQLQYILKKK